MQRRSLPIAGPCPRVDTATRVSSDTLWCGSCERHVHDLSARTELEARAFVAALGDRTACLRYDVRADGTIAFAPQRASIPLTAALALLAACAGWLPSPAEGSRSCLDPD